MSNQTQDPQKVRLRGVRLSFPVLFRPKAVQEGAEPKYGANFLLHKVRDKAQIAAINSAIERAITDKWPKGKPKGLKVGLHEANEKDYDGYDDDHLYLSSSSTRRPPVVDQRLSPLAEGDGKPYAGCYVNATVRAWAQDNQYGKRINFELQAVQFAKDGEAFGGGAPVNAEEEFEELDEEDAV